jgi:nitrate/nitrite-specific signal transduction histidine kinase
LKGSLRNKIITWSFVPTAIILVTVALVSLYAYQRVTENLVIERDRELTRLSARLLGNELAAYTNPLADQYLAIFDGAVLFDAEGEVLAAEPMQYEIRMPTWFRGFSNQQGLDPSAPIFSDVIVDRLHGDKLIVVAIPLAGKGSGQVGGVAGFFRLDPRAEGGLSQDVEALRRGESNCIYLVDGNGQVIHHSNPEYVGSDFSGQATVQKVHDGWTGAYRTRDLEGREIVASYSPVPGTSWGLVMEESWAALSEASRRYGQLLLLLLGLGIVLPTLIVTIGVRRITQPIAETITAAQEMARGQFGRRIEASTGDELEALAEQFNLMADHLQESYASLEQKVADRTRELATLNAITAQVNRSLELQEILESALDQVLAATKMDAGEAYRLDEDNQALVVMAQRGLGDNPGRCECRIPLAGSLAGQAAEKGQPLVWRPVTPGPPEPQDLAACAALEVVVSVPLIAQGRMIGALNLGSHAPRRIPEEEMSLLASIGQLIGVAAENARLYGQAQQLAIMKERNRLARDLHDSVTQALYGINLYAEAASRQLGLGQVSTTAEHLLDIRATAQESLREMRLLVFELRLPMLKNEGLAAAIQARLEAVEARVGMKTTFRIQGEEPLASEVEEGLYRIAQEALNNALRHAQASSVAVYLGQDRRQAILEIVDDGIGFDPKAVKNGGGFGLRTMAERAARLGGTMKVESEPGHGTRVRVEVCS